MLPMVNNKNMDFTSIFKAGLPGILLGILVTLVSGLGTYFVHYLLVS